MSSEVRYSKRLIEVDLPIKEISVHARREKSIRHGHISTMHIWWARRPLAACRAITCAALWPDPADELCPQSFRDAIAEILYDFAEKARTDAKVMALVQPHWTRWKRLGRGAWQPENPACWFDMRYALLDFIADFANWDASLSGAFLDAARRLTAESHTSLPGIPTSRPTVLDPFAGGGAFPLEAGRIGAAAFAYDLNPIPVLLNKLMQEHIPSNDNDLILRLDAAAKRVRNRAIAKLRPFYKREGEKPLAFIWARTIRCEGPGCGVKLPLLSNPWLCKRRGRYVWIEYAAETAGSSLVFRIKTSALSPIPAPTGTSKMGSATCPSCGYTTPKKAVYAQLVTERGGAHTARLMAIVVAGPDGAGKIYVAPTEKDVQKAREATLAPSPSDDWLAEPINSISPGKFGSGIASPTRIGCKTFSDLFNGRQKLALGTFAAEIQNEDDATVRLLLACAVDRLVDYNSAHCRWAASGGFIGNTFGRQAVSIVWTFAEVNPFSGASGDWDGAVAWIRKVVEHLQASDLPKGVASRFSATALPLPDDSIDAVLTDPPYYGAIMYGDLSDFFYVWLKRTASSVLPELFGDFLVPKEAEIIATPTSVGPDGERKDARFFEAQMEQALRECRRVVAPSGVAVVVFAHKSTSSWEAMLSALITAGWVVTASWPIDTERAGRTNAQGTAALGSSVHLVCRPRENPDGSIRIDDVGDWRSVLKELPHRIHEWMPRLSGEGVVGADAIFACLGPALEIFSRYSYVEKATGERVGLKEYLEHVWATVAREALTMIFEDADATGLEEDARLTAMWLWTLSTSANGGESESKPGEQGFGEDEPPKAKHSADFSLEFDAARKIAQGLGAHLENLGTLVEIKGNQARLLPVAERTKCLFGKDVRQQNPVSRRGKAKQMTLFAELEAAEGEAGWGETGIPSAGDTTLDRVHQAMILFAAGRSEALKRFLVEEGAGHDAKLWKLAQSLSALYPAGTDEKRWVDGVLARKKGLGFG